MPTQEPDCTPEVEGQDGCWEAVFTAVGSFCEEMIGRSVPMPSELLATLVARF